MRSRARALSLACLFSLGACSSQSEDALRAEVSFEGFRPGCIEITAGDAAADPATYKTTTVLVTADRVYNFGIKRKEGSGRALAVTVIGREGDCSGPEVARAVKPQITLKATGVTTETFLLLAVDGDGDGFVKSDGGTDCNDAVGAVNPGRTELCSNNVDDNCDSKTDCQDSACVGTPCDDGDPCTETDVCSAAGMCQGTAKVCNSNTVVCRTNPGSCVAAGGCLYPVAPAGTPCGTGMQCRVDGACVAADTETNCSDGITNDSDALVDCADPDCNTVTCDAGLCVAGATCSVSSGTCGGGTPTLCAAAAVCRAPGVCNPSNGQCSYPLSPGGTPCNDGNSCSIGDHCTDAGVCSSYPLPCMGGFCAAGMCDAGACVSVATPAAFCNDTLACTHSDSCGAIGVCSGTAYTCASPPECRMATGTSCDGDGGCSYPQAPNGSVCDGGFCVTGSCSPGFPYAVSNFVPANVLPAGNVVLNCAVTFDTTDGGVTGNWCGGPAPNVYPIMQNGGVEQAVVLSMRSLSITAAGTLRLIGNRPAIVTVFDPGVTTIAGFLNAQGIATVSGAGGNRASCGLQRGGDGGTDNAGVNIRAAGGGGGGFGSFGAIGGTGNSGAIPGGAGGLLGGALLVPLVGGCQGGNGGLGLAPGGPGGAGGGALQLTVAGELRILSGGKVSVSGGGGTGGPNSQRSGGGAGGSGGGLLLEANLLTCNAGAVLTANGGGGGEGGDANEPGGNGDNGSVTDATPAAGGTNLASVGGAGGNGAAGVSGAGPGIADTIGGGGGGGVGRILVRSPGTACAVAAATFSPPRTNAGNCP